MRIVMSLICFVIMVLLAGCRAASTDSVSSETPAVTDTPAVSPEVSEVTPEPTPSPTPSIELQEPENPIDKFSDEDKAIIKQKFTFSADPQTDKKITSWDVKDGTYVVQGPASSYGHVPYVGLTIKDGQVVEVIFFQYNPDTKSYKDENYGKEYGTQYGEDTFEKAQISVEGSKQYPVKLIETQDMDGIDAISGATYNYSCFKDGVKDALDQAKK